MRKSESKKQIKEKLKKVVKYLLIYISFLFLLHVNLSTDFHNHMRHIGYACMDHIIH